MKPHTEDISTTASSAMSGDAFQDPDSFLGSLDKAFGDAFTDAGAGKPDAGGANGDKGKALEPGDKKPAGTKDGSGEGEGDYVPVDADEVAWWRQEKAGKAFDRIKKESKAARTEVEALKARLAELEEPAGKAKVYETELGETRKRLALHDIQSTEEWQSKIARPLDDLVQTATDLGGDELIEALSELDPKKQREALAGVTEEMSSLDQLEVSRIAKEIRTVMRLRGEMLKDAEGNLAKWKEQEELGRSQKTESQRKEYQGAVDLVWGKLGGKLEELFQDPDTGGLTKEAAGMLTRAKNSNLAGSGASVQAYAALAGEMLVPLVKQYAARGREIAELKRRLGEEASAVPGGGDGRGGGAGSGGGSVGDELSFAGAVDRKMRGG